MKPPYVAVTSLLSVIAIAVLGLDRLGEKLMWGEQSLLQLLLSSLFSVSVQVLEYHTWCRELEQQVKAGGVSVQVVS